MKLFIRKSIVVCIITALSLAITSCGFRLQAQNQLPPQLSKIYIQTNNPYGSLEQALATELKNYGVNVADDPNKAPTILHLTATDFTHSDITTGPSTQARIYNLSMFTSIKITTNKGKTLLDTQIITTNRNLTLGSNEIFDVSTLVDITRKNMQKELITKIINVLCSKKISAELANNVTTPPTSPSKK